MMRAASAAIVALFTTIALLTSVMAQSRKVLVLPLDGSAPPAQRTALNASVVKLAKDKIGGDVTAGETTFNETAAAVGCSPEVAGCAEQVRATLAVDELVYGTATVTAGTTTVTVVRVTASEPVPKTQVTAITETDSGEAAEAGLAPLFDSTQGSASAGSAVGSGSGSAAPAGPGFFDTTGRKVGVALIAVSVLSLAIGFSQWSGASSLQDDIDAAPSETIVQINALMELEDRAGSKALWGNVFVVLGLAAGGVGGYMLWKDKKSREASTTITPAPVEAGTGMTFVLRGRW